MIESDLFARTVCLLTRYHDKFYQRHSRRNRKEKLVLENVKARKTTKVRIG